MIDLEQTDEQYLSATWIEFSVEDHRMCCGENSWRGVIVDVWSCWGEAPSDVIRQARAFTEQRLQEIERRKQAIGLLAVFQQAISDTNASWQIMQEIFEREKSGLDELKRGMK